MMSIQYIIRHYDVYTVHYQTHTMMSIQYIIRHYDVYTQHTS